jgi:hypothetical protein
MSATEPRGFDAVLAPTEALADIRKAKIENQ